MIGLVLALLSITVSAFGGTFPGMFSVNFSKTPAIDPSSRCAAILTDARAQFVADNPEFEKDPASVSVFADRLQELGSSYGDYLVGYAAGRPRKELEALVTKNAGTWFPESLVREAQAYFFDDVTGRLRGIEFSSFSRIADFNDNAAFQKLGLDTIAVRYNDIDTGPGKWMRNRDYSEADYSLVAKTLDINAREGNLTRLSLELNGWYTGNSAVKPLLAALNRKPGLKKNLKYLRLENLWLFQDTSVFTNFFKGLSRVESLEIADAALSIQVLRSLEKMPKLTRLSLRGVSMADHYGAFRHFDAQVIEQLSRMTRLEYLDLEGSEIVNDQTLFSLTKLKNLAHLNIRSDAHAPPIDRAMLESFAWSLTRLKVLVLGEVSQNQKALEALIHARSLVELHLPKSQAKVKESSIGLEHLRAARPEVKIVFGD